MISINWHPGARELRWFAGLQILFFALVSWMLYRRTGRADLAALLWGLSGLVGVAGLAVPGWIRWFYVAWMTAVFPLGWLISHVLLTLVYLLVVTPVGGLLRLARYDPLTRRWERERASYWIDRPPQPEVRRYFRQF